MNTNIAQLYSIAQKKSKLIIGLMSGTSLDGLDIALCRFTGSGLDTKIEVLQFETAVYNDDFKQEVSSIFSKKNIDLEKLCLLNAWIATVHANMINTCLKKYGVKNPSMAKDVKEKRVKEKVYEVLLNNTDLNFLNNRRKPSKVDFNNYYFLLKNSLKKC